MSEKSAEELKREEDYVRLALLENNYKNLSENIANALRGIRDSVEATNNSIKDINDNLSKYPIVVEKVYQHDKWIIGTIAGFICLLIKASWDLVRGKF